MKSAELSDDDLIRGCVENNRKSQEMLYRRYARTLFRLCLLYDCDRDNAKDMLQDSFIKIFRSIKGFDRHGSLNCWMKKIVTNTAIDHYRKSCIEAHCIPIENVTPSIPDEESVSSILNAEDIISQVNRLPRGARLIFQLHAIEGYSHKEIAELLHISESTSKSQINRAKQLLQHWVGEKACNIKNKAIGRKG